MPPRSFKPNDVAREIFPDPRSLVPTADGLIALGGPLTSASLREAYRKGIFPWEGEEPVPWFSPDPRCILVPQNFRASRSLRKLDRRGQFRITADRAFADVMRGCARIHRPGQRGTWISERMIRAYVRLHHEGIGHSVEVWRGTELVGGLYGLSMGGAFFGESMFSVTPSASKLAVRHLCQALVRWDFDFIDCQDRTDHLSSLGAHTLPRMEYLDLLDQALDGPDRWNPEGVELLTL